MSKPKNSKGRNKYPWDKWLKRGSCHVLVKGKHFTTTTHSFISYLYQRATHHGARIQVEELKNGLRLTALEGMKKSA